MQNAVLSIWYNNKSYRQGKFFSKGKKSYFIVNIDDAKLVKNFNGYAISKRVLDKFSELKIRNLTIIYRFIERKTIYITNPSTFKSKGILVKYGGHSQYVLPLTHWKPFYTDFTEDEKDYPVMDLEKWSKDKDVEYTFVGNTAVPVQREQPVQQKLFL